MTIRGIWCIHGVAYLMSFLALGCAAVSYYFNVTLIWTSGTTKTEIISDSGIFYLIQNEDWWRKEKFKFILGHSWGTSPIETWIGMRIDSQTQFLGFTHAVGKWISPALPATADTELTDPRFSRAPGMYWSTTPVKIYGMPYWCFLVFPLIWMFGYNTVRLHRRFSSDSNRRKCT